MRPGRSEKELAEVAKIQLALLFSHDRIVGCGWFSFSFCPSLGWVFVGGLSVGLEDGVLVALSFWSLRDNFFGALWGHHPGHLFGVSSHGVALHAAVTPLLLRLFQLHPAVPLGQW